MNLAYAKVIPSGKSGQYSNRFSSPDLIGHCNFGLTILLCRLYEKAGLSRKSAAIVVGWYLLNYPAEKTLDLSYFILADNY